MFNALYSTFETPRPSRLQDRYQNVPDGELARAQAAWDAARGRDEDFNAVQLDYVARAAREHVQQQVADREREAKRQADAEAPLIENARAAFLRAGGSAEDFEKQRGDIVAQARAKLAVEAAVNAAKPAASHVTRW